MGPRQFCPMQLAQIECGNRSFMFLLILNPLPRSLSPSDLSRPSLGSVILKTKTHRKFVDERLLYTGGLGSISSVYYIGLRFIITLQPIRAKRVIFTYQDE